MTFVNSQKIHFTKFTLPVIKSQSFDFGTDFSELSS